MNQAEVFAVILSSVVGGFLFLFLLFKLNNRWHYGPRTSACVLQDPTLNKSTVRFLHLNVGWRTNFARRFRSDDAMSRARSLLQKVDSYDVVCLNEAFSFCGSPVKWFIREMQYRGFVHIARTPPASILSLEACDGGVVILSRLPILATDDTTFSLNVDWDMVVGKGAVYARLQTGPGTHVHLFATQLQNTCLGSEDMCRAVKFAQVREMLAMVRRRAMDGQPIVFTGDMNLDALEDPERIGKRMTSYNRLVDTLGMDMYTLTDGVRDSQGGHIATMDSEARDYVIMQSRNDGQYIVESQQSKVVDFGSNISKHSGIETDMTLSLVAQSEV